MTDELNKNSVKDLFNSANSYLLILPPEPDSVLLSSALSLHLSLKFSGKQSQIGCSTEVSSDSLLGQSEIVQTVGSKNLHISLDFLESDLNKVDYEVDPFGKFSIIIHPKDGSPIPDTSKVKFSYSGASADLVIVFAVSTLEELGPIYAQEKKFLDESKILSINNVPTPIQFTGNLYQGTPQSTYAEVVSGLIEKIDLKPSPDAATNLIKSIYFSTANLTSPQTNPSTFAALAFLTKNGGRIPTQSAAPFFATRSVLPPDEQQPPSAVPSDWQIPKIFRAGQS